MIKIKTKKIDKRFIPMSEMKPMQIGTIISHPDNPNMYWDHVVMRTQSLEKFEIMDLSTMCPDKCWLYKNSTMVDIWPVGSTITLEVVEDI